MSALEEIESAVQKLPRREQELLLGKLAKSPAGRSKLWKELWVQLAVPAVIAVLLRVHAPAPVWMVGAGLAAVGLIWWIVYTERK